MTTAGAAFHPEQIFNRQGVAYRRPLSIPTLSERNQDSRQSPDFGTMPISLESRLLRRPHASSVQLIFSHLGQRERRKFLPCRASRTAMGRVKPPQRLHSGVGGGDCADASEGSNCSLIVMPPGRQLVGPLTQYKVNISSGYAAAITRSFSVLFMIKFLEVSQRSARFHGNNTDQSASTPHVIRSAWLSEPAALTHVKDERHASAIHKRTLESAREIASNLLTFILTT